MPHVNEKIDFTVAAYIVYKDKVLLRFHEKYHKWLTPSGHIELGEGPFEAIMREIKEETGLDATLVTEQEVQNNYGESKDLPLPMFINRHRISDTHEHIDFVYAAQSSSDEIKPQEGEMADAENFKWFAAEELKANTDIIPRVRDYALTALDLVKKKND